MLQNPSKSSGFSDLIYDMVIDCSDKERLIRVGRCEEMIDDKGEEFGIARGGESRLIKALSTLRIRKLYTGTNGHTMIVRRLGFFRVNSENLLIFILPRIYDMNEL